MTERVRVELERLENLYKGTSRSYESWEYIFRYKANICFGTFKKYVKLKEVEIREEKTLQELVDTLNSFEDTEEYDDFNGWYEVINEKAYFITKEYVWE